MHKQKDIDKIVNRILKQIESGTKTFTPENVAPIKRERYRRQTYHGYYPKHNSPTRDTGLAEEALKTLVLRGILYRDRHYEIVSSVYEWVPKLYLVR